MKITSKDNEFVKHVQRLKQVKYRREYGEYIAEGITLVEEAIKSKAPIKKIILKEDINFQTYGYEVCVVSDKIFEMLSDTVSPQGVLAVIEKSKENIILPDFIVALDGINDPGNLGTIMRSMDAAGFNTIFLSHHTVDAYNAKVIRSTMGSIYRMHILDGLDLEQKLKELKKVGYKILITDLSATEFYYDLNYEHTVIVIGNEANGVSEQIKLLADKKIKIPMIGKAESLNASVAASVIFYEVVRQKLMK